jgi:hypothetical protein
MRDVRRFYIAVVYILSQYCGVKQVLSGVVDIPVKPAGLSPYGKYSRGTRWLTAHSRSEVTVPILRATRFAGNTSLPSVP